MIETVVSSVLVSLVTQVIKKAPAVPVYEGQKLALRGVAIGLSLVSTLILAWLTGQLSVEYLMPILNQTIITYFGSVLAYYGLIR